MAPDNPKRPKVPTSGYTKEGRFDRVFVFGDLFNVLLKVEVYHARTQKSLDCLCRFFAVCMHGLHVDVQSDAARSNANRAGISQGTYLLSRRGQASLARCGEH